MAELYETGLRRTLEGRDLELPASNVHYLGLDPHTELEQYEKRLDETLAGLMNRPKDERPTAIFTGFDGVAEAIYLHLMRMGVEVPGAVSLVSFGGAKRLSAIQYRLSAVTADEAGVGRRAAELLHEMRMGKRDIELEERFEIELGFYEGQTLASV
jgi:DNA-binding LacI/PurR family transcriptional regulator